MRPVPFCCANAVYVHVSNAAVPLCMFGVLGFVVYSVLLGCCYLIELRFELRSVYVTWAVVAAYLRYMFFSIIQFFLWFPLHVARWRPTAVKPLAGHLATKLRHGMVALMVALCGALHGGTATPMA